MAKGLKRQEATRAAGEAERTRGKKKRLRQSVPRDKRYGGVAGEAERISGEKKRDYGERHKSEKKGERLWRKS